MTTDVDVQYFSHLNGLTLGNNWGDMIRLLDACLVNGLPLTSITSATIDAQGDIHLTTYAAHNCMLFQIIELTGFTPAELNGKYRIKGVPSANQLILKAEHVGKAITTTGAAKLASLGYEIIFRDANDVKRVYRAKNPTAQHPFIRVDETISDAVNSYNSAYAKYAMVGLLEHMDHIDDYENPDVLQLPFDPTDPAKNWKITGTGTGVVRGWSRWYWARNTIPNLSDQSPDMTTPTAGNRRFTITGDKNCFYFLTEHAGIGTGKVINGCGLYNGSLNTTTPDWFLMCTLRAITAATNEYWGEGLGYQPLMCDTSRALFYGLKAGAELLSHVTLNPIEFSYASGANSSFSGTDVAATEIGIYDSDSKLRGNLRHVCFAGKNLNTTTTTPIIADQSMYVADCAMTGRDMGGFYFYIGELE